MYAEDFVALDIIMNELLTDTQRFRSYSHGQITHNANHRRNSSTHSIDIFNLIVPTNTNSTLSHLICSICSLPMMKPTILPCQHSFCFKCIQSSQQTRSSSVPIHSNHCLLSSINQTIVIKCQKCSQIHNIKSLSDLEENQSIKLLINTLSCEQCHQLYSSNQLDTCSHCFGVICPKCYQEHVQNHQNNLAKNRNLYRIVSTDETININMITNSVEKDQNKNSQIFKPRTLNTEEKYVMNSTRPTIVIGNSQIENSDPSQINSNTKKKSNNPFRKIMNPSRHRRLPNVTDKNSITKNSASPVNKQTTSTKSFSKNKKLTIDTNIESTPLIETTQTTVPVTPVGQFLNLHDQFTFTGQHIKQCKQRQSELDRTVKKLIEMLTMKTTENINQITQYWLHFKQTLLDRFQSKTNRFLIIDYLLKACCSKSDSRKQIDLYVAQNDEIKAAVEALSMTLMVVTRKESLLTISYLFDREQQATIRKLKHQLESLLSSYSDGLSIINEFINVYETRFATWRDPTLTELNILTEKWTQIIKEDYPSLVEIISNDFITTIPQIEKVLIQMLSNMQKRLLNMDNRIASRRTSLC
ncbi:unnamed protein product [Rotaria magnacalcarata]|uniref:RING-type domain-containing protein n=3 Tax=Rotaria magnacalcarata TaxID=392030 RepID=A0A819DMN9_9BILA|nr:unnamed protein product [Rotaria magnacalcarata]CAF3837104.1 unnamed protein product [Rotaria magnacalcarata]CAF3867456.1 unnamed protein product [Rotaria magnacalcarata]